MLGATAREAEEVGCTTFTLIDQRISVGAVISSRLALGP
jgi:hypothetical protein